MGKKGKRPDKNSKKWKPMLYNIAMFVCAAVFLVCAAKIINRTIIQPAYNKKVTSEANEIIDKLAVAPEDSKNSEAEETKIDISLALSEFQKINPDIVSIISIPGTDINYPVVGAKDKAAINYYLDHNYKKEWSNYGSIIADFSVVNNLNAKNIVLYGHHMKDGVMFAKITKYGKDIDFYKKTPVVIFHGYYWLVFAVDILNTETQHGKVFDYVVSQFSDKLDFLNYVNQVCTRSVIQTPVKINENDQILLMSTCSYEYENFRTVVFARKLRIAENKDIDTSSAIKNPNPLMPDIYYSGGNPKPQLLDFKTAFENNSTNWYDGNFQEVIKEIKERN